MSVSVYHHRHKVTPQYHARTTKHQTHQAPNTCIRCAVSQYQQRQQVASLLASYGKTAHRQQTALQTENSEYLTVSYSASLPFFLAQEMHFLRTMELLVASFKNVLRRQLALLRAIKVETMAKPKIAVMTTMMKSISISCSICDSMSVGIC